MNKKSIIFLLILILIPVVLYLLWPSDERRIKKLFRKGSEAVEKEDLSGVMSVVSYNYRDDYGLTYLYVREHVKSIFQRMRDIKVEYENLDIKVNDATATAEMDVRVIGAMGNETGYFLGDLANPEHLKFTLEKERTKWLVTKTEKLPGDLRGLQNHEP
ncbi:MAG: hypothetical protein AB1390_08700 [Nitrospirota bacterium]